MDGKNACRNTDKKFHNNKNTVDCQGNIDPAVPSPPLPPFEIDCADAPKDPKDGEKFGKCDQEEICGKIASMSQLQQDNQLYRLANSPDIMEQERRLGDNACSSINGYARQGKGINGNGKPGDMGFHPMSDGCRDYKQQKAEDNDYVGFSPDHVQEIQLGGLPTDPSNLVWMESKTNSWIGGQFKNYDPAVQGEISGNCCD
jgi:hypothetical protein